MTTAKGYREKVHFLHKTETFAIEQSCSKRKAIYSLPILFSPSLFISQAESFSHLCLELGTET